MDEKRRILGFNSDSSTHKTLPGQHNMQNDANQSSDQTRPSDKDDEDDDHPHESIELDEDVAASNYNHQCYICDKTFSANSNLNRHLRKIHKENVQSPYNNVRCALCELLFSSSSMYTNHLEKDHQVSISTSKLKFETRELFDDWKHSVENETRAQFIKSRGEKRTKNVNKTYYSCNRSGYFVSKARTHKALKKQGSRKINGRCPASMNVTVNQDASYDVRFISTHVGHDFDLKHLDLSEKDRDLIVRKLASGVTKREIIRQIRSTTELHQSGGGTCSPATSSSNGVTGTGGQALNGSSGAIQPIVINSRSSLVGCGDQQIEVVVQTVETSHELEASSGGGGGAGGDKFAVKQEDAELAELSAKHQDPATSKASISRLHLATTKDIHNIINAKHLDSKMIRHNYDLNTVDAWINELRAFGCPDSAVLFYKDQTGLVDKFPQLRKLDFMLVLMKEGQGEILKQFGNKCVIIDSTHGIHCEYLHVTYVSVIDEHDQAFPVAYLFSSRTDLDVLEVFFTLLKNKVGPISTRMLIADDLHDFYQAWWKVMSMPVHNLLTPWSVFESLAKKFDLVGSRDKLRKIKKQLRSLLTETEADKFASYLAQLLSDYKQDHDTSKFIETFDEQFAKNPDVWSNCFRKNYGISNYKIWNMHDKFKTIYKEGKNSKKMCKYVALLMSLFEASQLERLLKIEESNRLNRRLAIEARHRKGIETGSLVYEVAVEPAYWLCPSECSSEVYDEVRQSTHRPGAEEVNGVGEQDGADGVAKEAGSPLLVKESAGRQCCELRCAECQTCRHEYKCTCLDYVVGFNMCKHIHRISALCRQD